MTKKQKIAFLIINFLLFIGVIIFLNDRVAAATSRKVAPILVSVLFINSIITNIIRKDNKYNKNKPTS